ncbi:hypothetical protein RHECNPAF_4460090 [Rhizobium etli CNPAF512]|nr:hypothetical protein RHECNPAF_4460090 [Rhizobium etli CNPAF512]
MRGISRAVNSLGITSTPRIFCRCLHGITQSMTAQAPISSH